MKLNANPITSCEPSIVRIGSIESIAEVRSIDPDAGQNYASE